MRAESDYFKNFLEVHPGGGSRRNPKRKNAGSFSTKTDAGGASAAEVDAAFQGHLSRMAKGGTYGDNMELVAFAKTFNVDVTIYKREFAYQVYAERGPARQLHIAYHVSCLYNQYLDHLRLIPDLGIRTLFIRPQHPRPAHWHSLHRGSIRIHRIGRRSQGAAS